MAKFVCDHCHSIENTALGGFWIKRRFEKWFGEAYKDKSLCARCLPETTLDNVKVGDYGKWHNRFKQEIATKEWALVYKGLACTRTTNGMMAVINGVSPTVIYPEVPKVELKSKHKVTHPLIE